MVTVTADLPESDDLESVLRAPAGPRTLPQDEQSRRIREAAGPEGYAENCPRCGGSGRFHAWSGRDLGPCRACQGKGKRYFKTSPEQREAARQSKAAGREAAFESWAADHQAELAYLIGRAESWPFAADMITAAHRYGCLTENQMRAVRSAMARDAERAQERQRAAQEREAAAPAADVSRITAALQRAQESGLRWPKLRLAAFTFSLAGADSKNAGAVYVKSGATYLGKVAAGKFLAARECTAEQSAAIIEAAANPAESAVAHGHMTGACACCGRALTDPESVRRGIGPICAERFGF